MPTPAQLLEVTPQVGDVGTAIQIAVEQKDPDDVDQECLTIPLDGTAVTDVDLIFQPPEGPSFVRTAQIITANPLLVQYVWVSGDLRTFGRWQVQPHLIEPTRDYRGRVASFLVLPNLDAPTEWHDVRPAGVDLVLPQAAVLFT